MDDNRAILPQQEKQTFLGRVEFGGQGALAWPTHQGIARQSPRRLSKSSLSQSSGTPIWIAIVEGEFVFCLDEVLLAAIQRHQGSESLSIPRDLMVALRQNAFWQGGQQGYPQAGLTFCSRYVDSPDSCQQLQHEGACDSPTGRPCQRMPLALRSVIALDGDIIHQIRNDSLQHPHFPAIVSTHHWVIDQLMAHFRISASQYIDSHPYAILIRRLITWVPVGSGMGFTLFRVFQLQSADIHALKQYLLGLLISALGPLSRRVFSKLLLPSAANWALRQVLSPNPRVRSFARRILGRFIP